MPAVLASSSPLSTRLRRAGAGAVALAGACSVLAATGATASAAPRCDPPGQQRSATVARADRPDGTAEVTEALSGGEYRVTRCRRDGRLLVSQTVSPIRDPDGGLVLVPTEVQAPGVTVAASYGDPSESSWANAFRAARAALRAAVIPPTEPLGGAAASLAEPPAEAAAVPPPAPPAAAGMSAAAVAGDACTNSQWTGWLSLWAGRSYGYYVNRSRFNYNDTSVASIARGHTNWDRTYNSCGLNDITNLNSHHLGSTSATIHSYADGASVTDRGNLASVGCAGALACTWLFSNGAGVSTETDQRFSDIVTFSNVGASGAYDFESVATHESGHSIGLNHASSSSALTMHPTIAAGTTHTRSLAKGDVTGLRTRYP